MSERNEELKVTKKLPWWLGLGKENDLPVVTGLRACFGVSTAARQLGAAAYTMCKRKATETNSAPL